MIDDGFLSDLLDADYVAIDTETDGKDVRDGSGYLMGISLAIEGRSEYLPFRHSVGENLPREWLNGLRFVFPRIKCAIFHNAKFDIPSLRTIDLDCMGKFYDTMLMGHMIDENLPSKSLEYLGQKYCHEGKAKSRLMDFIIKDEGWAAIPAEIMAPYAKQDAALTLKLFHKLLPKFKKEGFDGDLWDTEQSFVRLLIAMESNGVLIDLDLARSQAATGRCEMARCIELLGFDPGKTSQLSEYLLSELKLPVVSLTPKGKPCFDKNAMLQYDALLEGLDNDSAKLVRAFRGWQKACAVAYEGYPKLVSSDKRLRPNYKLHGTVTGRLSCEQPNLQQIPRVSSNEWDGALKSLFIAKPGYELWEADYSQLELRLGASYAKEQSLISEFANPDGDVFTRMARELGFDRGTTKTLTYTLQYGGGINRLCSVFKVDVDRAAEIRNSYFDTYPGFREITQKASRKAVANGHVKMWTGRKRHFKNPETESFKAFNSVIQGGAAEIVKRAMLRLDSAGANSVDCRMLLQVHDSVVFEIRKESVDYYLPIIRNAMEKVEPDFGVRFAVDIKQWGEK